MHKYNTPEFLFRNFTNRDKDLLRITRFSLYKVMFYRSNLFNHAWHVAWLVDEIAPFAMKKFPQFDSEKAQMLALVHDDAEIIIGDIQAGNKSKMSKTQLEQIEQGERRAITTLAKRFPKKVGTYRYEALLTEVFEDETVEANIVMLADKIDAFGETLHEIYAGNPHFVTNVRNEYGKIPTPYEYYIRYLNNFKKKYPRLRKLLTADFWMFIRPSILDFKLICSQSKPHSEKSIWKASGYPHYDNWKKVILRKGDAQDIKQLSLQIEEF